MKTMGGIERECLGRDALKFLNKVSYLLKF
jgi:hypothetical protein